MKRLLIALALVLLPTIGYAQNRVTVDASFLSGNVSNVTAYPENNITIWSEMGEKYSSHGVDLEARVRITGNTALGVRFHHSGLHNARTFQDSIVRNTYNEEPDPGDHDSTVGYQELFGSAVIPKTHGHAVVAGFMWSDFSWAWNGYYANVGNVSSSYEVSYSGIVLGGEGRQRLGKLSVGYSGRVFPHATQSGKTNGVEGKERDAVGYELRGTASWPVAKHFELVGGYQFRHMQSETDLVSPLPTGFSQHIHDNKTDKGFLAGLRLSF
jgi:hypothetical protein